jgi:hypothetical protein
MNAGMLQIGLREPIDGGDAFTEHARSAARRRRITATAGGG